MCANKKSEAHSGAHECEWMPANQVSGVHPVSGAADLSLDLANRVPQLLPFSFEFLLELINIFVCTHKTRHPPPLGVLPNSYSRSFSGSAATGERSIACPRLSKCGAEYHRPKGHPDPERRAVKAQIFDLR
jgi:hypothetical protein